MFKTSEKEHEAKIRLTRMAQSKGKLNRQRLGWVKKMGVLLGVADNVHKGQIGRNQKFYLHQAKKNQKRHRIRETKIQGEKSLNNYCHPNIGKQ